MEEKIYCADCGRLCVPDGVGTGYATTTDGKNICYDCAGRRDRENLMKLEPGGKYTLYLVEKSGGFYVVNWPGTFNKRVFPKIGRHNMAGRRCDIWFTLGDKNFHGVNYGDNTQICHIQRTK